MNYQSQGRFSLIQKYINRWLSLPKLSRAILTDKVVTAFLDFGFDQILTDQGIKFKDSHSLNCDQAMRVNAQKFFRWLGFYDEQFKSEPKIIALEPVIVAAMPNDLKLAYLNEVYAMAGVYIGTKKGDETYVSEGEKSIRQVAASMTKENAEAQIAVIQLGPNPTTEQIKTTYRELKESAGTTLGAIEFLENTFPHAFKKTRRHNWRTTV
ncbi:hypothetical protein [Zooshikella sp. RANM57]|uniref:hypothetical protein n=1 Tax=Zooshikella sp. RANM57 TaxID=3425863 RepID=UPI003D700FFA